MAVRLSVVARTGLVGWMAMIRHYVCDGDYMDNDKEEREKANREDEGSAVA